MTGAIRLLRVVAVTATVRRLLRVVAAGGLATGIDTLVLATLYFGYAVPAGFAALSGALAGGVVNFVLNRTWVFRGSAGAWWRQALLYATVVVGGGAVLGSLVVGVTHGLGVPVLIAKGAAIAFVLVTWTYPMSARIVFRAA